MKRHKIIKCQKEKSEKNTPIIRESDQSHDTFDLTFLKREQTKVYLVNVAIEAVL